MSDDSSEQLAFKSVDAYYAIAKTLQLRKEYRRALIYCDMALRQDERHIPSLLLRSLCYMYLCETNQALSDVQIVLQNDPKNPHALLLLAEIYYLRGDFEEALSTFHRGLKLRPTIQQFLVGVHKCETAIQNSCTNCTIRLAPDLDLTEFYTRAFPPKRHSRGSRSMMLKGRRSESADEILNWPKERSKEMQRRLIKNEYVDFAYLEDVYNLEDKRMRSFGKGQKTVLPNMNEVIQCSKHNRKTAVNCGTYLDKHADLFHKLDPGFRNTKTDY